MTSQQPFTKVVTTLNIPYLQKVEKLEVLEGWKERGIEFQIEDDTSFTASGVWDDMAAFQAELQKRKVADLEKKPVFFSDTMDESAKSVILLLLDGEKWEGESDHQKSKLENFRVNLPVALWVLDKHFQEVKKNKGKGILYLKSKEDIGNSRWSFKGSNSEEFVEFFKKICDKKLETLSGFCHSFGERVTSQQVLETIYEDLHKTVNPCFLHVTESQIYVVLPIDEMESCKIFCQTIDISSYERQINEEILLSLCQANKSQSVHRRPSKNDSSTQTDAAKFTPEHSTNAEKPVANELLAQINNTVNTNNSSDVKSPSLVAKHIEGDESVMNYVLAVHKGDLEAFEKQFNVLMDDDKKNEGKLSLIANGEVDEEKMDAAHDAFSQMLQDYHFDLETRELDFKRAEKKFDNLQDDIKKKAISHRVRIKIDRDNKRLRCTARKDELSNFLPVIRSMLFQKRERKLVLESHSTLKIEPEHDNSWSLPNHSPGTIAKPSPLDLVHKDSRIEIHACVTDITGLNVSAIVNAANESLAHGGGVALAIARAAGLQFDSECREYLQQYGEVPVTENCITTAGNIPSGKVIHAVGPRWNASCGQQCKADLKLTFQNILDTSNKQQFKSIAIPSISSGIFGMPKHFVAEIMIGEVIDYLSTHKPLYLKHIHFVDIDNEMMCSIHEELRKLQKDGILINSIGGIPSPTFDDTASGETIAGERTKANGILVSSDTSFRDKEIFEKEGISEEKSNCTICLSPPENPKTLKCNHTFCTDCIDKSLDYKPVCPVCGEILGMLTGNQPPGKMKTNTNVWEKLPGYPDCGTITIEYNIPSGKQTENHPNPGQPFDGCFRRAFLPDNEEGRKVKELLKKAFDAKLIFTIGRSVTTGKENVVTWNDIHHKTRTHGGAQSYGYPDPDYLRRVQEELATKGVK